MPRPLTAMVALIALATIASPAPAVADEASEALEDVRAQWSIQPHLLVAGEMKIRCYRGGRPGLRMEPEEVVALVEPLLSPERSDEIAELRDEFVMQMDGFKPIWGDEVTTAFSGEAIRERWEGSGFGGHDRLYDGEQSSDFHSGNRQYTLTDGPSSVGYMRLSEFRVIGPLKMLDREFDTLRYDPATDVVSAENEFSTLEVERSTGFLRNWLARDGEGNVRRATYQWLPVETDAGAVLPTFRLRLDYRKGEVIRFDLAELRELKANVEIAPEEFRMAATSGAKMVDFRGRGDGTYEVLGTGMGGPDVLALAGTKSLPRSPGRSAGAGVLTSLTLFLLLVLAALLAVAGRRRRGFAA